MKAKRTTSFSLELVFAFKNGDELFSLLDLSLQKPKQTVTSPLLGKGDHPELDDSKLLNAKGIKIYQ